MRPFKTTISTTTALMLAGAVVVGLVLSGCGSSDKKTAPSAGTSSRSAAVDTGPASGGSSKEAPSPTSGEKSSAAAPESAPAGGAPQAAPQASAQSATDLVNGITGRLQQAVTSGGQPHPLTSQEVEALLRSELQKAGIPQP